MTETLFFDSYAIFELIKGNPNYQKYLSCQMVLSKLNLFELYYGLLRETDERFADEIMNEYMEFTVDYDPLVIEDAAKLRLKHKKQDLSMTDCMGYCIAQRLGIRFLTGDKEFAGFNNVEFVK